MHRSYRFAACRSPRIGKLPSVLAGASLCMLVAACHYKPPLPLGNAMLQNREVHVVEPEPAVPYYPPNFDGTRATLAIGRYRTGQTKPLEEPSEDD